MENIISSSLVNAAAKFKNELTLFVYDTSVTNRWIYVCDEEIRVDKCLVTVEIQQQESLPKVKSFSKWLRLLRSRAWVYRISDVAYVDKKGSTRMLFRRIENVKFKKRIKKWKNSGTYLEIGRKWINSPFWSMGSSTNYK